MVLRLRRTVDCVILMGFDRPALGSCGFDTLFVQIGGLSDLRLCLPWKAGCGHRNRRVRTSEQERSAWLVKFSTRGDRVSTTPAPDAPKEVKNNEYKVEKE